MAILSERDMQDLYSAGAAATKTSQNPELGLVLGMMFGTLHRLTQEIERLEHRIESLERTGFDFNRRLK